MAARVTSIRSKLMKMNLLTSGVVLLITTAAFFAYDVLTYRQAIVRQLNTLGEAIAANSTAALAFDNPEDARVVLSAFKADPHIVAAALYDNSGKLFAAYPASLPAGALPARPESAGYRFEQTDLLGFVPVTEGHRKLGVLLVKSDLGAIYERLRLYAVIAAFVIAVSALVAYLLSHRLQQQLSRPILSLAETARAVSDRQDYTVRASRADAHELDLLTDAFNHMLTQIQQSEGRLFAQLGRLSLLQHITRAIGDRQDLRSICQVVLRSLEENLPIDFGCVCLHDSVTQSLAVNTVGPASQALAAELGLALQSTVPIDPNGLARCMGGQLVYEPDVREIQFPFPQRLA